MRKMREPLQRRPWGYGAAGKVQEFGRLEKGKNDEKQAADTERRAFIVCVCVCGNRRDGRSGGENERVRESFIHKGEKAGAHSVMNNIFIAVTLSAAGGFNFSAVCALDVCPARFTSGKRM